MSLTPFYDPKKTYQENFDEGPFGVFTDGEVYHDGGEPAADFLGQPVYLPFGIAAGPLLNGKYVKAAFQKGFDIATYKTVRTRIYPANPWPNVIPVESEDLKPGEKVTARAEYSGKLSVTNSFGVPSFNPHFWQKDMARAVRAVGRGQVVVGSFQGTVGADGSAEAYIADFALAARLVKETGAKILEVNLSCPNEGSAHLLCFDLERSHRVVEAIKNEIGSTPLIMKLAYFHDEAEFAKLMSMVGKMVQGVEAINTIPAKVMDEKGGQALGKDRPVSGVGGSAIRWAGLEMVRRLKKIREENGYKFKIIGVGGVMRAQDYKDYVAAGADAVMSASGVMWNPYMAREIKKEILK